MNARMLRSILDRLKRLEDRSVKHRVGVVDSTGPLSVKLGGSDVPYTDIKCVGGSPAEGQLVSVLTFGHDAIVLGPIGPTQVPQARVYNSANLSVPNNTHTPLTFNSERVDVGGLHSTASNTSRLTAPDAGMYLITAHARFAANANGQRILTIRRNGTEEIARHSQPVNSGSVNTDMSVATVYRLSEGDYVEVWAYQNSGGSLDIHGAASFSPEFSMVKLAGQ